MSGYTVKITIEDTHPPVWRRIIIPEHISFYDLHQIIQIIFDWNDAHLHDFTFPDPNVSVSLPEASVFGNPLSEKNTLIDEFIREYKWIRYTYDFGDDWRHKIVFEKEVPDYDHRYATILKAKGNGFEEDSGGVWEDWDDEDYEVPEIPFSIPDVNAKLEKKKIPYRKGSTANKEYKPISEDIENLNSMIDKFIDQMIKESSLQTIAYPKALSAMASSIDQVKDFAKKLSILPPKTDTAAEIIYEQQTLPFAEIQNTKYISRSDNGFYKVPSDLTMSKALEKLSYQEAKDYCKYLRISYHKNESKKSLIKSIISTLSSQPQYFLYVLEEEELQELLRLLQCNPGRLNEQPDIDSIIKGMSLGLIDCACNDKNNIQTVQIAFSKEAEPILTSLKPAKISMEYKKLQTISGRIHLLLQPYGILDMDTLYEKYCDYWGNELNKDDLLRVAYWHCRFNNYVQTADYGEYLKPYIALCDIDMYEALSDMHACARDIPYKPIDKEELMQWTNGFCCVYQSWEDYELYLREVAHLKDEQLSKVMTDTFTATACGCSASYLIQESLKICKPASPLQYVDLWLFTMSIVMDTGIVGLKGYSRAEYQNMKGNIPPIFTPIDPDITTDRLKANTHIYEMPASIQERLYAIHVKPPEDAIPELEEMISGMKVKNNELTALLSDIQNLDEELSELVEGLFQYTNSDGSTYGSDFFSPLEKQEPYHRKSPKIGRNDPCPCGSGKKYKNCCGKNK